MSERGIDGANTMERITAHLRRHRWLLVSAVALSAIAAALDAFGLLLLIPFLRSLFDMGEILTGTGTTAERLLDRVFGGVVGDAQGLDALRIVCLLVVGVLLVKNVCLYASRVLGIRVEESFSRDLRNAVHAHLQRLPMSYFARGRAGQLITRVEADTREARLIPRSYTLGARHAASVVAHVAALLILSWRLTLLALVLIPVMVGILRPMLKRLRTAYRRVFDERGDVTAALQETVTGMRLIKASGTEDLEAARFARQSDDFAHRTIRTEMTGQMASPLSEVLSSIVAVALVWVGAGVVLGDGGLAPEAFLAFVTLALRVVSPIKALSQLSPQYHQGLAAADRFVEILDREPEADAGTVELERFESEIRFEGVGFAYGDDPAVLHDIDLAIRRGEVVAVVGPSGGGKSTLIDLIPRFADPTEGRITIDGIDTRDVTLGSLRSQLGLVSQDTIVFHDTVSSNIAYGVDGASTRAIEAAARTAHADGFIESLPEGYETVLGERGARLSGGQRQRIGLARAVLRDSPILILDEATSALDSESEGAVQEALADLFKDRTVVIIAHRLSTVRSADRIVVIEDGRIVGEGTHDELLAGEGPYARLFERQLAAATTGA